MNNNFFRQVFGRSSPDRATGRGTDDTTDRQGQQQEQQQGSSNAAAAASNNSTSASRNTGMRMNSPQDMFASFMGVAQDYAGVAAAAGAAAAAMAGVEAAAVEAAIAASLREHEQRHGGGGHGLFHSNRSPPASDSSVRNLPVIEVRKEDLIDPANRECCICLEDHVLHGKAVRLPCAHLFHKPCILDWLSNHSCTCPVCRYEMPTDNVEFERHRHERMRHRKPRFARHELERLSNRELKQLLPPARQHNQQQQRQPHFLDRAELINHLIESGAVDLVAAPPPVEYRLSVLKSMKASELRRVMNQDAGVYFDPSEVVEKQDMINIFLSSGRLTVLPEENEVQADQVNQDSEAATFAADMEVDEEFIADEPMEVEENKANETLERKEEEEEDRKPAAAPRRGPVVETVLPDDEGSTPISAQRQQQQQDLREDTTLVMEENESFVEPVVVVHNNKQKMASSSDTIAKNDGEEQGLSQTTQTKEQDDGQEEDAKKSAEVPPPDALSEAEPSQSRTMEPGQHRSRCCRKRPLNENNNNADRNAGSTAASDDGCAPPPSSYSYSASALLDGDDATSQPSSSPADSSCMQISFQNLSVSELRRLGQLHSINLAGCIEKHEMVKKLSSTVSNHSSEAAAATSGTESTSNNNNNHSDENHIIPDALINKWGVSEILLAASLLDIDLTSSPSSTAPSSSTTSFNHHNSSNHRNGSSMENGNNTSRDRSRLIQSLLQACHDRPHVGRYLEALAPLMRLTVPQLRARARAERVTVSDCLEKGDLLRRLLYHSIASSTTSTTAHRHQEPQSTTTVH